MTGNSCITDIDSPLFDDVKIACVKVWRVTKHSLPLRVSYLKSASAIVRSSSRSH